MKIERINVHINDHSYAIHIGDNLLKDSSLLQGYINANQVMIVSNETVMAFYLDPLKVIYRDFQYDTIILPDGELYKTLKYWEHILNKLAAHGHHRDTTLIALGGGVVGDITGFAAACYQRGVDFIQLPTTLLAQVDASIGGKTAVNHPLGKNLIGAFHQPKAVIIDLNTLKTLPEREFKAGIAEIIKAALIMDNNFFNVLENNLSALLKRDFNFLQAVIKRVVEIKKDIVTADEKESIGKRVLLNLGHTFAHAIEQLLSYRQWLHGEAVSTGLVLAAQLSYHKNWLDLESVQRICRLLTKISLPIQLPRSINISTLLSAMHMDKKVANKHLRLILLKRIGNAVIEEINETELKVFLENL